MDHAHNDQPDVVDGDNPTSDSNPADPLKAEQEKAELYLNNWKRAAADLQNFKRRTEEERAEQARLQKAALIINILPVFDDLSRAVESIDARLAGLGWVQGIANIHRKFASLLEAMDVRLIEADGADFDPNHHEAIGQQAGPEGKVVAVVQPGYMLGDRVLRPAMVIVGNGGTAEGQGQAG